jgi:two-component system response regulator MtrA
LTGGRAVEGGRGHIVIVEDDEKLGPLLARQLETSGYATSLYARGDEAMAADVGAASLVVLDLMLPGAGGLEVLRALRRRSDVPIVVLTARRDARDVVESLRLGADDFVTKPFSRDELLARVEARLRRPALRRADAAGRLVVDEALGFVVDAAAREARVGGVDCGLTRVEFDLLHALVRRPGAALPRGYLVEATLDPDREGTERTLDVHVSRLRKKLGPAGERVETVRGIGYRLRAGPK